MSLVCIFICVQHVCIYMCGSVAKWLGSQTCDKQVVGLNPGWHAAECNPGKDGLTDGWMSHSESLCSPLDGKMD